MAAALIAEIGDATQFGHAKQLVAYAGLDPSVFSSGKFTASSSKITKRGSKRLRRAVYVAVQCGLRKGINERIKAYYDKKKERGQALQGGRDCLRQQASPSRLCHSYPRRTLSNITIKSHKLPRQWRFICHYYKQYNKNSFIHLDGSA